MTGQTLYDKLWQAHGVREEDGWQRRCSTSTATWCTR
jgi:hypothetical protein